VPAFPL
jgi:ribosome-associated protein